MDRRRIDLRLPAARDHRRAHRRAASSSLDLDLAARTTPSDRRRARGSRTSASPGCCGRRGRDRRARRTCSETLFDGIIVDRPARGRSSSCCSSASACSCCCMSVDAVPQVHAAGPPSSTRSSCGARSGTCCSPRRPSCSRSSSRCSSRACRSSCSSATRSATRKSGEAALKYLLLVLVSTAVLLYGMSLIYGSLGTSTISEIGAQLASCTTRRPGRRARARAAADRLRLQDHGRAVPLLGARRLRGRADAGHRVHVGRLEVRRLRARAAHHRRPACRCRWTGASSSASWRRSR